MWKLKCCPKCSGDLFLIHEEGWRWHCLQCGYDRDLSDDIAKLNFILGSQHAGKDGTHYRGNRKDDWHRSVPARPVNNAVLL